MRGAGRRTVASRLTAEALARDYKEIVREAERYLGPKRVAELNKEIAMARRGNRPNRPLNALVLAEWDAAAADGPVDIPEFSRAVYEKYPQGHSARAVEKRLKRLLTARDRDQKLKARLKALLQRPSFLGEVKGTE